jgi:hypothetical protein
MWISVAMFSVAGLVVFNGGVQVVCSQAEETKIVISNNEKGPNKAPGIIGVGDK